EIAQGIHDGLWIMISLASRDDLAFWSVGCEPDRSNLVELMRRHRLPPGDPQYFPAPHHQRERMEAKIQWTLLRKRAIADMHKLNLPKDDRRQIHGLRKDNSF